jgi:hypothetical protein
LSGLRDAGFHPSDACPAAGGGQASAALGARVLVPAQEAMTPAVTPGIMKVNFTS